MFQLVDQFKLHIHVISSTFGGNLFFRELNLTFL